MCVDPSTTLIMMMAITAASGVMKSVNSYYSAKAQNKASEYNARVMEKNAANAEQDAEYARGQSQRSAVEKRKEVQLLIGAQRAKAGASGATVNSGSFADVQLSTAEEGEKDAMAILQQADLDAWRYENQAGQYRQQATLSRAGKVNAGSVLAGGLLTTAAQTAMTYGNFNGFGEGKSAMSANKFFDGLGPGWGSMEPFKYTPLMK